MGEQTEASRYYPDGTVRLPDGLEAWVDSVMEGDKGDDPDQRLTWDQVRNVVDVVLWQLIYRAVDPDDLNEDAIRALLDALGHGDCHPAAPGSVGFRENEALARAERAERAETALRDLLYAKQISVDGTCPHCGGQACYEADSGMPLGVLRCDRTGLAVISSIARADIYEPLWVRARAALEASDG